MNLQLVTMLQFPRVLTVLFTQFNPKSVIIIALHTPLGPLSLRVTILGKTTAVLRAQHLPAQLHVAGKGTQPPRGASRCDLAALTAGALNASRQHITGLPP